MNIKCWLKRKVNSGKLPNEEEIWRQIEDYEVITFDCFDTLFKRNVEEATDVFALMEHLYSQLPDNFADKRIAAEKIARSFLNGQHKEVTLREIYDCYEGLSEDQKEWCIKCEKEIEGKLLVQNSLLVKIYKRCIANNRKIFVLTDTYMPLDFMKELFDKNGLEGYTKLYVSSEVQAVKADGSMYSFFLHENHLSVTDVIHIGDSRKSDLKEARKQGIKSILIPRYISDKGGAEKNKRDIEWNFLSSFIDNSYRNYMYDVENNHNCNLSQYYEFGYKKFGPLLLGLVHWISAKTDSDELNRLFFLSRDGFIIKKAFDMCYPQRDIKTYYLEVSRKSLRIPILWLDTSFDIIASMLSTSKLVSVNSLFDGLGLNIEEYQEVLLKCGLNKDMVFESGTLKDNTVLKELYNLLQDDIVKKSLEQYELLKQYLKQNEVCGKFGIVDIGYAGSMQRYLEQALDAMNVEHDIQGYYAGVAAYHKKNVEAHRDMSMYGYLFDCKNSPEDIDNRSGFVGLFEMLFLEQGGSVESYYADDGCIIKAKRAKSEYMDGDKLSHEAQKIFALQEGALHFVESSLNDELLSEMDITAKNAFWGIERTGNSPRMKDINLFGNFAFVDEGNKTKLANPKGMLYYLFHLKQLKYDFLMCRWKIGFLKKLFKIVIPYEKLYRYMLKFR